MDLGTKRPDNEPGGMPTTPKDTPKINYPGLSLNDAVAQSFLKEADVKLGDTITATVTFKVVGLRQDTYGHSVSLDAISMDNIEGGSGEPDGDGAMGGTGEDGIDKGLPGEKTPAEPDDEEKVLGFKLKKKAPKEAPDISAKTMFD